MAMMAPPGPPELSVSRYGLTQVYAPIGGGKVDVVFVHGLSGDPGRTWTSEKSHIFWPAQLLPPVLEEQKARILVYGYDADVVSFTDGASRDRIHNHAEHLVAELVANRRIRKATERPIVFVAHSLGGLVVKRALIYSSEIRGNHTEHYRSIFVSTYGILFLGTPHTGSDVAEWGSRLEWICGAMIPSKVMDTEPQLVEALRKNNETLVNIDRQFIQLTSRLYIYFFHEGKKTNLKGTLRYIVDEDSASPNIQDVERAVIQQDHSHMSKFESNGAPGFDLVAEGIQRYAGEAPEKIALRWQSERAEQMAKKRAEIEELLPGSLKASPNTLKTGSTSSATNTPDTSQLNLPQNSPPVPPKATTSDGATNTPIDPAANRPNEPYFIVPPGFRPNSFFVGRDKEYRELDKRLFDKRRRDGTACVLLHGQAGGGKTHLARQYVNKNKQKFSGGIFWITAVSKEERNHAFWNIKQRVVARDSPDLCDGVNANDFVQLVKTWFETRHDWLIVFDGVSVDRDEDAMELMNFIPDSKNSSIIYVSRQKNLESKQSLLRPFPIKIGPLKEADAVKLLFKELHTKKPTEAEKKKAAELVKKRGGLPLAIDAISHRIAYTHEPLINFKLPTSADPILEATYNQIFDDLLRLGHTEAWNLINILCWFAGNIPVEMVHLGLKVLRAEKIEVKTREDGGEPDINTTFGILIRYALIERNEPDSEKDSMSSSHDSLVEPEPIDMLKIHGVVQSHCCDSLNARRMLPTWLGYAVQMFRFSYRQADIKIKAKPEPGRISDYRYYLEHGQRLWDHCVTYESRTQSLEHIRDLLHPIIDLINKEIRDREPGSSQESLKHGIFQMSIFDRTSSSSDSGPPVTGPFTPNHRPTPPRLDSESVFGFPLDKEQTDSPMSFGTASPGPRPKIYEHSPSRRTFEYDDAGYDSDRENRPRSHSMQPNLSEVTERPPQRPRAPTTESHVEGWQIVPPARKPKRPRKRRDLGSFRPTVVHAELNKENAVRPDTSDGKLHRRQSSPAFKSLEKVQTKSPAPPLQTRIAGFIQRTLSGRSVKSNEPAKPSWASIAAGEVAPSAVPQPRTENHTVDDQLISPAVAEQLRQRGRSDASSRGRPGNLASSPLATEFLPYEEHPSSSADNNAGPHYIYYRNDPQAAYPPGGFRYTAPNPGSHSALSEMPQYPDAPRRNPEAYMPYYTAPPPGPPNSSFPIVESTTITTHRRVPSTSYPIDQQPTLHPSDFPSSSSTPRRPTPPSPQSRASPSYTAVYSSPYPPPPLPAGYSSQPMSRDHSHQSTHSNAATEPMAYNRAFSPLPGPPTTRNSTTDPLRPLPVFAPRQDLPYPIAPQLTEATPWEESQQGLLPRRSPNTDSYPFSIPSQQQRPSTSGNYTHQPSPFQQTPAASSEPMSRSSSSGGGPGIQLADGGVVAFEESPVLPLGSAGGGTGFVDEGRLQFGAHEPISLDEARRRVGEAELRAREREMGDRRRRSNAAPYPGVNLIPTSSDAGAGGVLLERMVVDSGTYPDGGVVSAGAVLEGEVGARRRGGGRPGGSSGTENVAAAVGLGVDLGGDVVR